MSGLPLGAAMRAVAVDMADALLGRSCPGCGARPPRGRPICNACDAAVPRSGTVLCLSCMRDEAPPDATVTRAPGAPPGCPRHGSNRLLAAGPAYEPPLDRILHAFKYSGARELHRWIATLVPEPPGRELSVWREYVLVPVPLHAARRAWRGFDQARLLASTLGRAWGLPVADALERRRDHPPQARMNRASRRANVHDAFVLARDASTLLRARPLLLIDDVATTGSTLLEAAAALEGTAPLWILALTACHGGAPSGPEPSYRY